MGYWKEISIKNQDKENENRRQALLRRARANKIDPAEQELWDMIDELVENPHS